jgi:hypothetical protein
MVEQGNRVLAVVAGGGTELIEDLRLRVRWRKGIARADGTDVFTSGGRGHRGLRGDRVWENAR